MGTQELRMHTCTTIIDFGRYIISWADKSQKRKTMHIFGTFNEMNYICIYLFMSGNEYNDKEKA